MISKELLSIVLNKTIMYYCSNSAELRQIVRIKVENNILKYNFNDGCIKNTFIMYDGSINIYELAHKCKEWALNKGYFILSAVDGYCTVEDIVDFILRFSITHPSEFKCLSYPEPESVFKACQWILEYKDKS